MSGYKPSLVLPGATEIPSASANGVNDSYAADSDGRSSGFNHNKPGVVVVDPDESESVTVDLSKVSKEALQKAAKAAANGSDFFQALAAQPKQKATRKARTPKEAKPTSTEVWEDLIDYEDSPVALNKITADAKPAAVISRESVISEAFAKLEIPFLTADVPSKPCFTVYFEFDQFGTLSSKYHQVIDSKQCLVLVYDTRFEYGQQYLPPVLDINQPVTVGVQATGVNYQVASVGLSWTMGCLDFVLLIKA